MMIIQPNQSYELDHEICKVIVGKKREKPQCPVDAHKEYASCIAWTTFKLEGENMKVSVMKIHSNKMKYCPICKKSLRKYIMNEETEE